MRPGGASAGGPSLGTRGGPAFRRRGAAGLAVVIGSMSCPIGSSERLVVGSAGDRGAKSLTETIPALASFDVCFSPAAQLAAAAALPRRAAIPVSMASAPLSQEPELTPSLGDPCQQDLWDPLLLDLGEPARRRVCRLSSGTKGCSPLAGLPSCSVLAHVDSPAQDWVDWVALRHGAEANFNDLDSGLDRPTTAEQGHSVAPYLSPEAPARAPEQRTPAPPLASLDAALSPEAPALAPEQRTSASSPPSLHAAASSPHVSQPGSPEVAMFIDSITLPIEPPLIASSPRLQISKARNHELMPRRSVRLAAKNSSRLQQPEAQATKVMLNRMGIQCYEERRDDSAYKRFQETFKEPMSSSKRAAMKELFPGRRRRQAAA